MLFSLLAVSLVGKRSEPIRVLKAGIKKNKVIFLCQNKRNKKQKNCLKKCVSVGQIDTAATQKAT